MRCDINSNMSANPAIARKLQTLINMYGWDQVMNSFPPKKVLNEVDRVQDTQSLIDNLNNSKK